jgi:hypothetical protein
MLRFLAVLGTVLLAAPCHADGIAKTDTPLLRELESRYEQCMHSARNGDVEGYWRLRTTAARARPPAMDAQRIRLLADLLPPLDTLQFVRLDATERTARALYRWRKDDAAQFSVIVYRLEQGQWKVDDIGVRRGGAPAGPAAAARMPRPPQPNAAAQADASLPSESQALLRAWERAQPDPYRRLEAPRL